MSVMDDNKWARLMAAAQQGDRRSYGQLLREVVPVVSRVIRRRLPMANAAEVEDVVQETLRSLHSARHTYDPSRPFLPWLLAIARYRATDELRRSVRQRGRETDIDDVNETFLSVQPNTEYDRLADRHKLKAAIRKLSPRERMAIELLKLQELSLKEAAERTGTSVAALKVATHRAMKKLRTILGGAE